MPLSAGSGLSTLPDPASAGREACERALEAAGLRHAQILFLFASSEYEPCYDAIVRAAIRAAGTESVVGCSASGVIGGGRELEAGPAVAALAVGGQKLRVEAGLLPANEAADIGRALGAMAKRMRESAGATPAIVLLPDLGSFEIGRFFRGLDAQAGFVPVVGGVPSGRSGRVFEFGDLQAVERRACAAMLLEGTCVEVAVAQSCRPIGRPAVVTRASGRLVQGLASKPALEFLGESLALEGLNRIPAEEGTVFGGIAIDPKKHPLERGDFLVRPIVGIDASTGAIALAEPVSVGQTVVFQLRDDRAAREDMRTSVAALKKRLSRRNPCFGLYFNCLERGVGLFGEPDFDVRAIRRRFPKLPIAGFFSSAEIAPAGSRNLLHTQTGVLAVFCESA